MEYNQGSKAAVLNTAATLIDLGCQTNPNGIATQMMIAFSSLPQDELLIVAKRNVQILKELSLKHSTDKNSSEG